MKKTLAVLLFTTAMSAQAAVPPNFCRDVTELAIYVMGYHQEGVPARNMYEASALIKFPLLDDLITDAVTYPRYTSIKAKIAVVQEFADKWRDGCIRATGTNL